MKKTFSDFVVLLTDFERAYLLPGVHPYGKEKWRAAFLPFCEIEKVLKGLLLTGQLSQDGYDDASGQLLRESESRVHSFSLIWAQIQECELLLNDAEAARRLRCFHEFTGFADRFFTE